MKFRHYCYHHSTKVLDILKYAGHWATRDDQRAKGSMRDGKRASGKRKMRRRNKTSSVRGWQ